MTTNLGLRAILDAPYERAIEKVTAALKEEGFGILTEIDVKGTLKKKLNADFRRYVILGACNPDFAHQALQNELEIGLLLPCNVVVYESDEGQSVVSILNPMMMMNMAQLEGLEEVADKASASLNRAIQKLKKD
jgi:uncharacterized protein (DUF302 family)